MREPWRCFLIIRILPPATCSCCQKCWVWAYTGSCSYMAAVSKLLWSEMFCIIKILNNEEGMLCLIQGPSFRLRAVVNDTLFLWGIVVFMVFGFFFFTCKKLARFLERCITSSKVRKVHYLKTQQKLWISANCAQLAEAAGNKHCIWHWHWKKQLHSHPALGLSFPSFCPCMCWSWEAGWGSEVSWEQYQYLCLSEHFLLE